MQTKHYYVVTAAIVVCLTIILSLVVPVRPLFIAGNVIWADVADSPAERSRGLQFRETLPPWRGMLFIFEQDSVPVFWMKDTPLPLSIAFLDSRKRIVSLQDMQPLRADLHYSPPVLARYALEMRQGWFRERGITSGDRAWFW